MMVLFIQCCPFWLARDARKWVVVSAHLKTKFILFVSAIERTYKGGVQFFIDPRQEIFLFEKVKLRPLLVWFAELQPSREFMFLLTWTLRSWALMEGVRYKAWAVVSPRPYTWLQNLTR